MRAIVRLALALALAGCGTTKQDVIDAQRPAMNELRGRLSAIALALPAAADSRSAPADLSPPPRYGTADANTDIMMYDQMIAPEDRMYDRTDIDLIMSNFLLSTLLWTGPENPMAESSLNDAAGDFDQKFVRAAGLSYVGVARVVRYEPAVPIDEETYSGGRAEIEAFLVSMSTNEVVCSFSVSAAPQKRVSYIAAEMERFVRSDIWENGRAKLISSFGEFCGGEFVLQ